MTVEPAQQPNLPANVEDFSGATGLEDFGVTDAVIPRLQIIHKEGVFKDNLSGQTFSKIRLIILGLVKQRILWHPEVEDDAMPMCKSPDFGTGFPNLELTGKKAFPWEKAGFDPNNFPMSGSHKPLPCANCQLKEWGSHPNGNNPYCSEQWTLPVYYDASPNPDEPAWMPAILSLQKSSIKPIRSYLTSFARTGKPAFTAVCEVSLTIQTRGQVDYSVPSFQLLGESDRNSWMEYSENYAQMKGYLTAPPRDDEDAPAPAQSNVNQDPRTAAAQPQEPPAQQPVQQQASPPQQAQPPAQPVAQTPPPAAAPPPAAPAPTPPPAGNDDLPF